jgi:hypothetical protein
MDENIRLIIIILVAAPILFFFITSPLRVVVYVIIFQKIIDILWFVQVSVGPFRFSPQRLIYTLIPILLIPILLFIAPNLSREIKVSPPTSLVACIAIFVIWYFINLFRAVEPIFAIEGFTKALGGYVMFAVGWLYFDGKDTDKKFDEFARLYVLTFFIPALGVFLQLFGIFQLADIGISQQTESNFGLEFKNRYAGFYNDSGTSAMYVWSGFPLALYLFSKRDEPFKWVYAVAAVSMITTIIVGFGRGMYLTLGVLLVAWLFINKRYFILLFGAISLLIFFFASPFLEKFFVDLFLIAQTGKLSSASMSGKALYMETEIELFSSNSFLDQLFGKGFGQNSIDITNALSNVFTIDSDTKFTMESEFFSFQYDLGLLGWIPFVLIPFLLAKRIYSHIAVARSLNLDPSLILRYSIAFSLTFVLMISLFGRATGWVSMSFPLWFLMGFALKHPAFYELKKIEAEEKNYIQINPKLAQA